MITNAKYIHTNLVTRDWVRLARFYADVFGCELLSPERDLWGTSFEKGVAIAGARARGVHLRLPGTGTEGPTLEIFQYETLAPDVERHVHRPGYAHIAFSVASVEEARDEVVAAGGSKVGEIVETLLATGERIRWCYVTDIDGNIIELQSRQWASGTGIELT